MSPVTSRHSCCRLSDGHLQFLPGSVLTLQWDRKAVLTSDCLDDSRGPGSLRRGGGTGHVHGAADCPAVSPSRCPLLSAEVWVAITSCEIPQRKNTSQARLGVSGEEVVWARTVGDVERWLRGSRIQVRISGAELGNAAITRWGLALHWALDLWAFAYRNKSAPAFPACLYLGLRLPPHQLP